MAARKPPRYRRHLGCILLKMPAMVVADRACCVEPGKEPISGASHNISCRGMPPIKLDDHDESGADERPSFVFILADDWGWGDCGAYGASGDFSLTGTRTRTPTLDVSCGTRAPQPCRFSPGLKVAAAQSLARNGTLFTDFHADALCCPSRAAWMTGRYAGDLSFRGNLDVGAAGAETNKQHGLPFQLPTPAGTGPSPFAGGLLNVASLLQASGWRTAHYGKWVRVIALLSGFGTCCSLAKTMLRQTIAAPGRLFSKRHAHALSERVWLRRHSDARLSPRSRLPQQHRHRRRPGQALRAHPERDMVVG